VVEEDHRKKLPSNWEAKQRQLEWEEEQERVKKVSVKTCLFLLSVCLPFYRSTGNIIAYLVFFGIHQSETLQYSQTHLISHRFMSHSALCCRILVPGQLSLNTPRQHCG